MRFQNKGLISFQPKKLLIDENKNDFHFLRDYFSCSPAGWTLSMEFGASKLI
jgi:hypothetical protein